MNSWMWIGLVISGCGDAMALPDASSLSDAYLPRLDAGAALTDSGPRDSGPVSCPSAPPYDESDQALIDACTRPIVVGVGNGLRRAVSFDGQSWDHDEWFPNMLSDQNENSHRDVAIARGLVVVVGDGGLLVSADAGATYTVANAGRFHDSSVTFFQGAFWVVSNLGTFSSADGALWMEWSGTTMLPGGLAGEYSGGSSATDGALLVSLDWRTNSYRVFDGSSWSEHALSSEYGELGPIVAGGGRFVILGQGCCDQQMFAGLRAASSDGAQTFMLVTNATPGAGALRFGSAFWDGDHFFATASQYDQRTYDSTDGLSWTTHTSTTGIGPVTRLGSVYVGANAAALYRSDDGAAWTMTHTAVGDAQWGFTEIRAGRVLRP